MPLAGPSRVLLKEGGKACIDSRHKPIMIETIGS